MHLCQAPSTVPDTQEVLNGFQVEIYSFWKKRHMFQFQIHHLLPFWKSALPECYLLLGRCRNIPVQVKKKNSFKFLKFKNYIKHLSHKNYKHREVPWIKKANRLLHTFYKSLWCKWNPSFASQQGVLEWAWEWKLEYRSSTAGSVSNFPQGTTPLDPFV